ncbi:MAG: transglutaminase family protein [Comamonadaceae bacterium]|nr:MAG: transglutaminase family protein [Comamonadaceae bacterium]
MRLKASCTMTVNAQGDCPVIAMLRPRSGHAQWIISERYELEPWVPTTEYVDSYGNLCQRLVIPQGGMRISVEMTMQVDDQIAVAPDAPFTPIPEVPDDVLLYLLQSRYCPSDKMREKALQIVGDTQPGYQQAEAIRGWIQGNLTYQYGVSSATTDAMDTLGHGAGVCRDFAHVGIALCRSLQIPARMVVGYLHELDPMDLHAWFEAFVGGRWYTFDATQDQPRGGRIVLAYGRDAADVAFLSDYAAVPLEMQEMRVNVIPV